MIFGLIFLGFVKLVLEILLSDLLVVFRNDGHMHDLISDTGAC